MHSNEFKIEHVPNDKDVGCMIFVIACVVGNGTKEFFKVRPRVVS